VLPAHAQFSYLREPEKSEKDYVERITASLDFAFDRARNLQYAMAERNKLRHPDNQYKPAYEPGDLLLVWEKASSESRLQGDIRRWQGDQGGKLPGKLRNPWQGPHKMIRWSGDRKCILDVDGKKSSTM
jgi:hypothetical protein